MAAGVKKNPVARGGATGQCGASTLREKGLLSSGCALEGITGHGKAGL